MVAGGFTLGLWVGVEIGMAKQEQQQRDRAMRRRPRA